MRPVAACFVGFGMFLGVWAVVVVDLERALHLGHGGFGLLLAVSLAGSAAVNGVSGPLAERWGTSRMLARSLTVWSCCVVLLALARPPWLLGGACALALGVGGAVDVAMNVAASAAFVDEPGRLVRFHARFNAGAVIGAGSAALVLNAGLSWRWLFGVVAVLGLLIGAWCGRATLPAGEAGDAHGPLHALRTIRSEHLVFLALVFACGAMVEGGIDTWGVLVLRQRLGTTVLVGAGAYVTGQAVATAARITLGPAAGALGAVRGLAVGGGLAAAGLVLVALAPAWGAAAGLAVAAAGISVCWPLLLSRASTGQERPAAVVGGVTAIGYLGFVIGPPLVGALAGIVGLRPAILTLAAAAAVVAVVPRRLPVGRTHGTTAHAPSAGPA
jgi:MFS family permease